MTAFRRFVPNNGKKPKPKFKPVEPYYLAAIAKPPTSDMERLELAIKIATAACEVYGTFAPHELKQFREQGIWGDHVAVRAALEAINVSQGIQTNVFELGKSNRDRVQREMK